MTDPLKHLSELAYEYKKKEHPSVPEYAIPRPKYSDKDSSSLTACIMDYIKFLGGYSVRINTQGQYNEKLGIWTKGSTARGTADIHACYKGVHYSIEVKIGKDRQSPEQKETEEKVKRAGGEYFIARDFAGFYSWFKTFP